MQNDGESFDLTLLELINEYMLSEAVNVISELREPTSIFKKNKKLKPKKALLEIASRRTSL
mgnify:CR=1 FL=1